MNADEGPLICIDPILVPYHVRWNYGCLFTSALMAFTLADVRTVRGRPEFRNDI
jgi:hypothetical protein